MYAGSCVQCVRLVSRDHLSVLHCYIKRCRNEQISFLFQCDLQSTKSNILLELFCQIISEPCFNTLRTQEQLGRYARQEAIICGISACVQRFAFLGLKHNAADDVLTLFAFCLLGYIVFSGARRCNGAQVVMIVSVNCFQYQHCVWKLDNRQHALANHSNGNQSWHFSQWLPVVNLIS